MNKILMKSENIEKLLGEEKINELYDYKNKIANFVIEKYDNLKLIDDCDEIIDILLFDLPKVHENSLLIFEKYLKNFDRLETKLQKYSTILNRKNEVSLNCIDLTEYYLSYINQLNVDLTNLFKNYPFGFDTKLYINLVDKSIGTTYLTDLNDALDCINGLMNSLDKIIKSLETKYYEKQRSIVERIIRINLNRLIDGIELLELTYELFSNLREIINDWLYDYPYEILNDLFLDNKETFLKGYKKTTENLLSIDE